jgi:hypothetical protein
LQSLSALSVALILLLLLLLALVPPGVLTVLLLLAPLLCRLGLFLPFCPAFFLLILLGVAKSRDSQKHDQQKCSVDNSFYGYFLTFPHEPTEED